MRRLLFILLLLPILCFPQQKKLLIEDVSYDAAGNKYSDSWNPVSGYWTEGDYLGLMAIVLDIDSSTTVQGNDDSTYYVPYYKINQVWYVGDTIEWDRFNTSSIDDAIIDTNIEWVLPSVYHDSLLVWRSDPTSTTNIEGYPCWDDYRIRMYYSGDSVDFSIDLRGWKH